MPLLSRLGKLLIAAAAVWAIGASLYWLLAPQTVHVVTATAEPGAPPVDGSLTVQQSWYQVQGLWGVIVLFIFAAIYVFAVRFALQSQNARLMIAVLVALLLIYLAGLSIGMLYMPAALALLAGALLLLAGRQQPSSAGPAIAHEDAESG